MLHILVADDDPQLCNALARALRLEGYLVSQVGDGARAVERVQQGGIDLLLVDQMMPVLDGVGVCQLLRSDGHQLPILMLTARDTVAERVRALDEGADDHMVKPFSLEELLARLRALLRRQVHASTDLLTVGDLTVDVARRTVRRRTRQIDLTRTEFRLLELFARNAEIVLTRDQIMDRVWGYDSELGSNSLDVYVGYLRRKTEGDSLPRVVHTVRGVGYVLRAS